MLGAASTSLAPNTTKDGNFEWHSGDFTNEVAKDTGSVFFKSDKPSEGALVRYVSNNYIDPNWWPLVEGTNSGADNSPLFNAIMAAASWHAREYGTAKVLWPGGGHDLLTPIDPVPEYVELMSENFNEAQLNAGMDLPSRYWIGDNATTVFDFPFGTSVINEADIEVILVQEIQNPGVDDVDSAVKRPYLLVKDTDYSHTQLSESLLKITLNAAPPTGSVLWVKDRKKCAFLKLNAQQARLGNGIVLNRLDGQSHGVAFMLHGDENDDFGDDTDIDINISGQGSWDVGTLYNGRNKITNADSIREVLIRSALTFRCNLAGMWLDGVAAIDVWRFGYNKGGIVPVIADLVITGSDDIRSSNVKINITSVGSVLIDNCNAVSINGNIIGTVNATRNAENISVFSNSDFAQVDFFAQGSSGLRTPDGFRVVNAGFEIRLGNDNDLTNGINFKTHSGSASGFIGVVNGSLFCDGGPNVTYVTSTTGVRFIGAGTELRVDANGVYPQLASSVNLGRDTKPFGKVYAEELRFGTTAIVDTYGVGSPEGVVDGGKGSIYRRTDGGSGTCVYFKESDAGNTGWVAK